MSCCQWCSVLSRVPLLCGCGGPALSPTVRTSSGPLAIQVDPRMQITRKMNENWQLYLIMQPSAMCLQQTFFLRRVIILGVPIWVRLCFGNWFWILNSFLFEPPCWNPFYQCLWAEAEVLLPPRHNVKVILFLLFLESYRVGAGCSLGGGQIVGYACLALSALMRGLRFTPSSHIPDNRLDRLERGYTLGKEVTSALSHALRWFCSLWPLNSQM